MENHWFISSLHTKIIFIRAHDYKLWYKLQPLDNINLDLPFTSITWSIRNVY